ncbi:nucleotide-diphospho-sugar transferases [Lucifera butyrica]|uniref:Nucleotide-diphospho-sugar transferases n=1 Tax=Lucifera butyrica TaxID=1351585 RepID=A0A498RBT9_9FIRM|nr:glycosyl transferase [Lucifera butyrica]VBB07722.1 nucleotide-diphospho-sugar transferases [Lucifera butyrica]
MTNVMIASPVRQKPMILKEFLWSLNQLKTETLDVKYAFVDDHEEPSTQLKEFARQHSKTTLIAGKPDGEYLRDEITHYWPEQLMWKVATYKDQLLALAKLENCDYIFLVDSDLVLHPDTLIHLISLGKDIISEVYWTSWNPQSPALPQVWLWGQYELYAKQRTETLSEVEINTRSFQFLNRLRIPGTYKVGGIGACTLISRKALEAGVSFQELYNLQLIGEDRHFCIRAAALGFDLFADTHYPPFHIYRESELSLLHFYKLDNFPDYRPTKPRLILGMLVRNEAGKFLDIVLKQTAKFIDAAVLLDDASDDATVELCHQALAQVPHKIISNQFPQFNNEIILRKQLWQLTIQQNPDWILILDADELFEDRIALEIYKYITNPYIDIVKFRLYDMWDQEHYREDAYWCAHKYYRTFLVRYNPNFEYSWNEIPLHCGRFPSNIHCLSSFESEIRIKHLGWSTPELKLAKYARYKTLDPDAKYGIKEQYDSILEQNPNLIRWNE